MNRLDNLTATVHHYEPWNVPVSDWLEGMLADEPPPYRWLLIEVSNITGDYDFATFDSPEAAMDYQATQECAEDWEPIAVVDLDTGDVAPLERRYRTVFDTYRPNTTVQELTART